MSNFTTTCPACDRTCHVATAHIQTWTRAANPGEIDNSADPRAKEEMWAMPVTCQGCDTTFWVDVALITALVRSPPTGTGTERPLVAEQIPPLLEGTAVRICNAQHPLVGKVGQVTERKHLHYRVAFDVGKIWVPEHWVTPLTRFHSGGEET